MLGLVVYAISTAALLTAVTAPMPDAVRIVRAVPDQQAAAPFGPGERLTFDVRFGSLRVGTGVMAVEGIENVRGRSAWHTIFRIQGGTFFYRVNDLLESWIDTETLSSLRFVKDLDEGNKERYKQYDIYPERAAYIERKGRTSREHRSVRHPLDEGSFVYFVRTLPLDVGDSYEFSRYFIPDRNPVRLRVVRRERITVPAGTFNAVVVQPTIRTTGVFAEGGKAEMWLSDDANHIVLQLKTRLSFGSLSLHLRSYTLAPGRNGVNRQ